MASPFPTLKKVTLTPGFSLTVPFASSFCLPPKHPHKHMHKTASIPTPMLHSFLKFHLFIPVLPVPSVSTRPLIGHTGRIPHFRHSSVFPSSYHIPSVFTIILPSLHYPVILLLNPRYQLLLSAKPGKLFFQTHAIDSMRLFCYNCSNPKFNCTPKTT